MMIVDIKSDNPDHLFASYHRMADAIARLMEKNGNCLPQDLLPLGFTPEETAAGWRIAYLFAGMELGNLQPPRRKRG